MPILGDGEITWTKAGDLLPGDSVIFADGSRAIVHFCVEFDPTASMRDHRELHLSDGDFIVVPVELMVART